MNERLILSVVGSRLVVLTSCGMQEEPPQVATVWQKTRDGALPCLKMEQPFTG